VADYQHNLFDPPGPAPQPLRPTLTQFYRDMSQGRFVPSGRVVGWYTLPQPDAHYEAGNNGLNERMGELLQVAFEKADVDLDFGQFDNDGPDGLPNSGDDDGMVDTVFVVHSESGGECQNANLWSHSFQYSNFMAHSGPFVTQDVRRNEFGQPVLGANGAPERIQIEDYTVQPALACPSATDGGPRIIPIGVFCHEYGHALGLPDLYDRTPPSGPNSEGVGNYCLMAGGSYGATGGNAAVPVHLSAWCKAVLGWANLQPITANGTLALEPVQERNLIYNIDVPGTGGKEFFLIEYRDPSWTDTFNERLNWDRELNPGGLAIWHVDERVGDTSSNWPFAPHDQGQNDAPSLPSGPQSFRHPHSLVTLMQADGQLHLERKTNRGDLSDLFGPGASFADDPDCRSGSRAFNGQATGISIKNINLAGLAAQVRVDDFPPGAAPLAVAAAALPAPRAAPPIAAAAPVPPPSPEAQALRSLGAKVLRTGQEALDSAERTRIGRAPEEQIRQNAPKAAAALLKIAAQERTRQVDASYEAVTAAERAVKRIVETSRSNRPASIRFDSSATKVQRMTGLDIPTQMPSAKEDAQMRVETQLKGLIGENVKLMAVEGPAAQDGAVPFKQVVDVAGRLLPLYGDRVKLYYSDNALKAVESNVVAPDSIHVTGSPDQLSTEEAKQVVMKTLGVPRERIAEASHLIYLPAGDPAHACVSVKVNVKSGDKRKDLEAFVNCQTKQVFHVK
jgi:M6 family metalloprotease-like protein